MCWELDEYESWEVYQKRVKQEPPSQATPAEAEEPQPAEAAK